jgi:hypothetical protein
MTNPTCSRENQISIIFLVTCSTRGEIRSFIHEAEIPSSLWNILIACRVIANSLSPIYSKLPIVSRTYPQNLWFPSRPSAPSDGDSSRQWCIIEEIILHERMARSFHFDASSFANHKSNSEAEWKNWHNNLVTGEMDQRLAFSKMGTCQGSNERMAIKHIQAVHNFWN